MTYDFPVMMHMTDEGFEELRQQKADILSLLDKGLADDRLNGIVHLIDHIQDTAVDHERITEEVVFAH